MLVTKNYEHLIIEIPSLWCASSTFQISTSNSLNPKRFIHIPYKSDTAKHGGGHFRAAMINMSCTKNKNNFSIQTDSIPIEGKSNSQQIKLYLNPTCKCIMICYKIIMDSIFT